MSLQTHAFARRNCDGLAQIGPTRFDVTGIRFLDGEGAGAPGGDGGDAAAVTTEQQATDAAPWTKENFDPERAWKRIENMQAEATEKAKKTEAAIAAAAEQAKKETLAEFGRLLTGEKAPETDPVKLAATIAEKDTMLAAAKEAAAQSSRIAQAAVLGITLGANVPALLADPAFQTSLASVDPTKEADIKSVITQALQANATLKQPPRSSGDVAPTGPTVQTLESLLAAAEKAGNATESIVLKRRIQDLRNKS